MTSLLTPLGWEFVTERHLATLSTLSLDGTIHVVPVGFTLEDATARVITNGTSQKVRNIRRSGLATICQVDGGSWLTLQGTAQIVESDKDVAHAVELYAQRYRQPKVNPLRVTIAITVTKVMGSANFIA
ncbi:MAG: PPOX class F420-dependent oxidoreductase [Microbacteriaceae bacterium]